MIKRILSLILTFALLAGFVPGISVCGTAQAAGRLVLSQFTATITDSEGEESTFFLMDGQTANIYYNYGDSYVFSVSFSGSVRPARVFVTSTTAAGTSMLEAVYNESEGCYLTSGYFDNSQIYTPGKLSVKYYLMEQDVPVSDEFDVRNYVLPGIDKSSVVLEKYDEEGRNVRAWVPIKEVLKSGGEVFLEALIDTYDPVTDAAQETLDDFLGYYEDLEDLVGYVVKGVDDERYIAYMDWTDRETYAMILHDVTNNRYTKLIIKSTLKDKPLSISSVADKLATSGKVASLFLEHSSIENDMDELRAEVSANSYLTTEEAEEAYKNIQKLENDKKAFALTTTMLPLMVAAGAAGGPAGLMFSALLAGISSTSEFFWDKRIAGIQALETESNWMSTGTCGGNAAAGSGICWTLSGGKLTIEGQGTMQLRGDWPFEKSQVEEVVIGEGILDIYGFSGMTNLRRVSLPSTLKCINSGAFSGCTNLRSITLPEGLEVIYMRAFEGCTSLESISIPSTVKRIWSEAFDGCSGLETVYMHTGSDLRVLGTGSMPFNYCTSLEKFIFTGDAPASLMNATTCSSKLLYNYLPTSDVVTTFYYDGTNETWTDIAATWQESWHRNKTNYPLVAIGAASGYCGDNVKWTMDLEGNLLITGSGPMWDYGSISYEAPWRYVENLNTVVVDEGVTYIGKYAFYECDGVTDIVLPETVEQLGSNAIYNCRSLKEFYIPGSLILGITPYTFGGCSSLQNIYVSEYNPVFYADDGVLYNWDTGTLVRCPEGKRGACMVWEGFTLEQGSFQNCAGITTVVLPLDIERIWSVFPYCYSLTDVYYMGDPIDWAGIDISDSVLESGDVEIHYSDYDYFQTVELSVMDDVGGTVTGDSVVRWGDWGFMNAVPDEGYRFEAWVDEEGAVVSEESFFYMPIEKYTVLQAVFTPIPTFEETEIRPVNDYFFTHRITLEQQGEDITLTVTDESGDAVPEDLAVFAVEYSEDGQMLSITSFVSGAAVDGRVFTGSITGDNVRLYLVDGECTPMMEVCCARTA